MLYAVPVLIIIGILLVVFYRPKPKIGNVTKLVLEALEHEEDWTDTSQAPQSYTILTHPSGLRVAVWHSVAGYSGFSFELKTVQPNKGESVDLNSTEIAALTTRVKEITHNRAEAIRLASLMESVGKLRKFYEDKI